MNYFLIIVIVGILRIGWTGFDTFTFESGPHGTTRSPQDVCSFRDFEVGFVNASSEILRAVLFHQWEALHWAGDQATGRSRASEERRRSRKYRLSFFALISVHQFWEYVRISVSLAPSSRLNRLIHATDKTGFYFDSIPKPANAVVFCFF